MAGELKAIYQQMLEASGGAKRAADEGPAMAVRLEPQVKAQRFAKPHAPVGRGDTQADADTQEADSSLLQEALEAARQAEAARDAAVAAAVPEDNMLLG
eukprot:3684044-Lingulodinium_polyedra.AAC.1